MRNDDCQVYNNFLARSLHKYTTLKRRLSAYGSVGSLGHVIDVSHACTSRLYWSVCFETRDDEVLERSQRQTRPGRLPFIFSINDRDQLEDESLPRYNERQISRLRGQISRIVSCSDIYGPYVPREEEQFAQDYARDTKRRSKGTTDVGMKHETS